MRFFFCTASQSARKILSIVIGSVTMTIFVPGLAEASYGPFLHGDGVGSLGFGGVSQVSAIDSYAIAGNPALAFDLQDRLDFGLDLEQVFPFANFRGNLFGPNERYESSFNSVPIPQIGLTRAIADDWVIGSTGFVAGFGTIYKRSPFERFGGPEQSQILIGQVGTSNVIAWRPVQNQSLGAAINFSYQTVRIRGLQPFMSLSESPDHFTNQGIDGGFGVGYSLGWNGYLTPWLEGGVSYRSKTWAQRFKDYEGVLPEQGRLEFAARYSAALAWHPSPTFTLAVEFQRALWADEKATGNHLSELSEGNKLGSDNGPGFGWRNQRIIKTGVEWNCSPQLSLRAGYSRGTKIINPDETLLSILAPATLTEHYTLGSTYIVSAAWQISGYLAYAPRKQVQGENSVPLLAGGGEIDVDNESRTIGVSVGYHWD